MAAPESPKPGPPSPVRIDVPQTPPPVTEHIVPTEQPEEVQSMDVPVVSHVDYSALVGRAVGGEAQGLRELRRKADEAGVVRMYLTAVSAS